MIKKWFAFPVARVGVVIVLTLAALLAFPATRAMAGKLLTLFRVQQLIIFPLDAPELERFAGNKAFGSRLNALISSSTVVTQDPPPPVSVANAEEAGALVDFRVRMPQASPPLRIMVSGASAFTMTIDRAKTQAFLSEFRRGDFALPDTLDGAEIEVNIPAAVHAVFGDCPRLAQEDSAPISKDYPNCFVFTQIPSPTVRVSDNVNLAELAQKGLEFSGMDRDEAAAFVQKVDWTTTLVVPIPRDQISQAEVAVDGVNGVFIHSADPYKLNFVLLWIKNDILYFISSWGDVAEPAIALANSLP
jgi:hypothetical protein